MKNTIKKAMEESISVSIAYEPVEIIKDDETICYLQEYDNLIGVTFNTIDGAKYFVKEDITKSDYDVIKKSAE